MRTVGEALPNGVVSYAPGTAVSLILSGTAKPVGTSIIKAAPASRVLVCGRMLLPGHPTQAKLSREFLLVDILDDQLIELGSIAKLPGEIRWAVPVLGSMDAAHPAVFGIFSDLVRDGSETTINAERWGLLFHQNIAGTYEDVTRQYTRLILGVDLPPYSSRLAGVAAHERGHASQGYIEGVGESARQGEWDADRAALEELAGRGDQSDARAAFVALLADKLFRQSLLRPGEGRADVEASRSLLTWVSDRGLLLKVDEFGYSLDFDSAIKVVAAGRLPTRRPEVTRETIAIQEHWRRLVGLTL